MVHGGIDGYSRLIVFLQCSNNNRSNTVLQAFQSGVQQYGLPERIRSDRGGENVQVHQRQFRKHNKVMFQHNLINSLCM